MTWPACSFALLLLVAGLPAHTLAADFAVFYANDVNGETEPCG
ncbi:MAG: hypothetical protein AB1634_01170 [Thermodesulfobacteriota bacterium]